MKVDSAIAKLLSLDLKSTTVSSSGGVGMSSASTAKITTKLEDGSKKDYFMKTATGSEAEIMFKGEHASLNALHDAVPDLCPASIGQGKLADSPGKSFLVTDFLDLSSRRTGGASAAPSLAAKMAKLHTTPAPVPTGFKKPMFGFPETTCCGDTPQPNDYRESWADFYAENRLRFILNQCIRMHGKEKDLTSLVETTIGKVVPRLIGDDHLNGGKGVTPVVVHGDLWSGNASRGTIGGRGDPQDVVYDPSAAYAHNEYDLGIMKMFGGFGSGFFSEYHKLCPKTEPQNEYDDRIALYELYHHLNHYALFGGGYKSGAIGIMRSLNGRYGHGKTEL
ncbi:MAG: hypothetical protein M1828_001982 [Chrysothrix sp. TS-e1954]|nr:MAG: hypothetical protein M1828_001982 [Chrysothrix sp. TS-e1954]